MRLNVVGLGMVGLPTALLFAETGMDVVGVDVDEQRLDAYRAGRADKAIELDVADLLRRMVASGKLTFSRTVPAAEVHIVAVGTPVRDGIPDLSGVRSALSAVAAAAREGNLLVLESTVPPGTTALLASELRLPAGTELGHAPERVAPGATLREMRENPRIVGGRTPDSARRIASLYARICNAAIETTDTTTAEFVKLIENTYRDVNIALANELALVAADLGIDAWRAIDLANDHPRVNIHRPGPGVGGHCIPVAPLFLRAVTPSHFDVMGAARLVNRSMPERTAVQALALCGGKVHSRVALLGLAYKPDVADDRDSPTRFVAAALERAGATCAIHDPLLLDVPLEKVLRDADCAVLLVAHTAYRSLDPDAVGALLRERRVLDTVHVLDRARWERAGFNVVALAEPIRTTKAAGS